jgi:dynein heavy chain
VNTVDPRDSSIEYKWFDVGMLDYDESRKLFLVQKVNKNGRVVDYDGHTVVNGGLLNDGLFAC